MNNDTITTFSNEWWIFISCTIFAIIFLILFSKRLSLNSKNRLTNLLASIFMCELVLMNLYYILKGNWILTESLPLHLCSIMWIFSIVFLLTRSQWLFEVLLFIGMPGAFHSLVTPELTNGNDLINKIEFFFNHGGLVFVPLFAIFSLEMWPRKASWIKSFFALQIIAFLVFLINNLIGSNYMFLMNPPIANNPLIPDGNTFFGKWPFYIIILEFAVLLHIVLIYLPFKLKGKLIR